MRADEHPQESKRLEELASYDILDTPQDVAFDDIVGLATRICEAPVGLISLVAEGRQWFKSEQGLGEPETDLDRSICAHAIQQSDIFEIPDTLKDERTLDNPICVGDPNLRFYAGAPLITSSGLPLGTLCILDYKPRTLTDLQKTTLRILADQVVARMEGKRALRLAEVQQKEVDHRVKNSLQSIASYARLLGLDAKEEETKLALSTLRSRIETVAALHEALYQSGTDSLIDLGNYLSRVTRLLQNNTPDNIRIKLDPVKARVHSRTATACAVILNEVVANAVKHAFPDGQDGEVTIRCERDADDYRLVCIDNGVGMDDEATPGLGLRIIDSAVNQLGGELERLTLDTGGHGIAITLPMTVDD
ncbi:histidine kinase dimerization/phosphoacceptor domain -containing protein [Pelagovum pacificum]|uniref:GAF domain-containing protein n=1 Tax=Pelagovum pacificum TaxID=2588711 RepID=A0A5C5GH03_9RHOB|nr:histidine kinase dimerization/phosphoacceptor domain -containing protein [Pelagovum pacificum]QQA42816.1 ATP-binding protein [Pelagovum pacificum]TNY34035.1 GAF domain-containing protein [Pelagovum pacificum]